MRILNQVLRLNVAMPRPRPPLSRQAFLKASIAEDYTVAVCKTRRRHAIHKVLSPHSVIMTDHAVGSHHDRVFWGELRGGLGVGAGPAFLAARHSTGGLRPVWGRGVAGSYTLS